MTDDNPYSQLISLLEKLSFELKVAQLWSEQVPSASQLQSSQPFCCDTLTFEQWLQFIFITRLSAMAKQKQALPQNILVSPMAEEVFSDPKQHVVIDTIADLDELLSGTKISRTWHVKNVNSAS